MLKNLLVAIFVTVVSVTTSAQSNNLCQGAYYTEAQGAEKLQKLGSRLITANVWLLHADSMKAQLRKGMELEVFPTKTSLNTRYRNKKVFDGYSVESVVFESFPGFFVTGNLYKPVGNHKKKSLPAILCTHGHSSDPKNAGRLSEYVQLRSAALAKMGAIVFAYDMIGYGESEQLPHKFEKAITIQTWNSIRVVDFLLSLPETDPDRVAVTGESGGGTQTFLLTALDERIKVSIPVVMVSSHFFGGCVCESGMPIHKDGNTVYSNAEIACLAAPRPMLLISDGKDWTKNTETVEYPFAKKVYSLMGKEHGVENVHLSDEGHDYGPGKRLAAYQFLAKHLGLSMNNIMKDNKVNEEFVTVLKREELCYFTQGELDGLVKGPELLKNFIHTKK